MENDSIFSKLAHGPEVSGNCQCPTKSNTTGRKLCLSMKQIYPVEALTCTREADPSWAGVFGRKRGRSERLDGLELKTCKAQRSNIRSFQCGKQHLAGATEHEPGTVLIYS